MDPKEYCIQRLEKCLEENEIPEYMRGGLRRYLTEGIPPGGFLTACICNDLKEAAGRADGVNQKLLYNYAAVMVNGLPLVAQGSRGNFDKWVARQGLVNSKESEGDYEGDI